MSKSILIVDDEKPIRTSLRDILEYEDYKAFDVANGEEALKILEKEEINLVLCDIKMHKMEGMEVLVAAKTRSETPLVMRSGHGTTETAVEPTKTAAYDSF